MPFDENAEPPKFREYAKDAAQSPLQVAIKCGRFEIIDLRLENGVDVDFMDDQSQKPEDTSASYFMSMSVLHDAIIGTFEALPYGEFECSEKYVRVIEKFLERGADPNKVTSTDRMGGCVSPVDTLVSEASELLRRYLHSVLTHGLTASHGAARHIVPSIWMIWN